MTGLKLEDPTVDVADIEKYRLAFLMQFFVQHKRRFRFPRLRLQDLYQRVIKDPEPTAFCDLVARILRFLNHGDPEICIDHVDRALDRFTVDKRTSYRIQMQQHRNSKPVHQLSAEARAALLDNLIESVYDEQPDFSFTTTGFNTSAGTGCTSGLSNGVRSSNGVAGDGTTDSDGGALFAGSGSGGLGIGDGTTGPGDFTEEEDVNVLIKAGQDAQGCSYYYMDDLRLYRERPQSGISSQWDVAVGPTTAQWQDFISSLSRNEKESDLYCFLQNDLFELVKDSLNVYELHAVNGELDTGYLRAKESSELADLRRTKGLSSVKPHGPSTDEAKFPLTTVTSMGSNGPKSASPAFSGGHGTCGIGSAGSSASGAPLTPSSARTPTSAPPATTSLSNGYVVPSSTGPPTQTAADLTESHGSVKNESNVFTTRPPGPSVTNAQPTWSSDLRTPSKTRTFPGQPNGDASSAAICPTSKPLLKPEDGSSDTHSPVPGSDSHVSGTPTGTETHASTVQSQSASSSTKHSPSPSVETNSLIGASVADSSVLVSGESNGLEPSHMERELAAAMNSEPQGKPSPTPMADGAAPWTTSNSRGTIGPSPLPIAPSQRTGVNLSDLSINKGTNGLSVDQAPFTVASSVPNSMSEAVDSSSGVRGSASMQMTSSIASSITSTTNAPLASNSTASTTTKLSSYTFDPTTRSKDIPTDPTAVRSNMATVRPQGPGDLQHTVPPPSQQQQQPSSLPQPSDPFIQNTVDCAFGSKGAVNKLHMNPTTALVPPMVGIPDGGATLTQEQWENRKSKIAQLEKIHSTLSKSKSASTPGAVTAAAGVVLQQQQQQQQQHHRLQGSAVGPNPIPPSSIAQSPGTLPPHALGVNASIGFGSPAYTGSQRTSGLDPYGGPRTVMMPGVNEMAQREWDRLYMDYQREKGEPPGPRFHPSCRQPVMYDPNGCPILPTDPSTPPGAVMIPGQMMIDHPGCGPNARHFASHLDGPPVVMVPPNNTNLTSANSAYPPPPAASGPLITGPQHFRPMASTIGGYPGPEQQVPMGMVPPPGHKRPYHGAVSSDSWVPSNGPHPMMSQVPMNESSLFPGPIQTTGPMSGARMGPMASSGGISSPSMGPTLPVSMATLTVPTTTGGAGGATNNPSTVSTTGRSTSGVVKTGGKKRKTAAANRAAASTLNAANAPSGGTMSSQTSSAYGKPQGPGSGLQNSITPTKPTYPVASSSYMTDNPGVAGPTYPHRPIYMSQSSTGVLSAHPQQQSPGPLSHYPGSGPDSYFTHYPDMTGVPPSIGRPMGNIPPGGPEGRRALTPKNTDVFTMGPGGTTVGSAGAPGSMSGGRIPPSGCQPGFPPGNNTGGSCPTSSMMHPYLQSPDGSVTNSVDNSTGMRSTQAGSYTQHLTSASLASLARLSQMSGPEGPPYAPGSSSNASLGSGPGAGGGPLSAPPTGSSASYPNRGNPMMAYPHHSTHHHQQQPDGPNTGLTPTSHQMQPPQLLRSHSVSGGLKSQMNHDPDQSIIINPSGLPPQSNPSMHTKFGAQGYHSQQSLPAGMLSTQPTTPTQQPPSIQVNNTFFNAQLNVQQMNYQHVSAPGSTGQMQIHFVQQQQQQQQQQQPIPQSHEPPSGHRSSRAPDQASRMSSGCSATTASNSSCSTTNTNVTTTTSAMGGSGPDYYHTGSEPGMMHRLASNYPNEMPMKPEQLPGGIAPCTTLPTSSSGTGPPVSGYGNTSIQITPKTPHTIQYLPTVTPNAPADAQQQQHQHNAQYTPVARSAMGRINSTGASSVVNTNMANSNSSNNGNNNTVNNNNNSNGASYGPVDPELDPSGAPVRQPSLGPGSAASFHPGHMYLGPHHPSAAPSQPTGNLPPSNYHHTPSGNSMKLIPSQAHPSNRALTNGPWSGSEPQFDPHNPMGPMPGPFSSGMDSTHVLSSGMTGRSGTGNGPGHPTIKSMGPSSVGYPPSSLSFPPDSIDPSGDHMSVPFMSDPMSINRGPGGSNSTQYGRPQPTSRHVSYDQNPSQQQQQHVYRQQQQYSHTQMTQQQQQQHQMFMSSNYITDGSGGPGGGQVQFVMSASSSAMNASSSTTMQNCSSNMMNNDTVGINQSSGSGHPDSKPPNYDHSKRALMMPSGPDEMKANQLAVYSGLPGSQPQQPPPHILQSQMGPVRTSGRPLSNTGMVPNPSGGMDPHFNSPYHPSGPFPGANFSQVPPMGTPYGDKTGRELMGNSQSSSMCDVSSATVTGLSQVTYQSPVMQ